MKLYIISELNHDTVAQERENAIAKLNDTQCASYVIGKEGLHDLHVSDGIYGLEDVLYQIHTSTVMAYVFMISGRNDLAIEEVIELEKIHQLYATNPTLFNICAVDGYGNTQGMNHSIMSALSDITANLKTYIQDGSITERLMDLLKLLIEIILNNSRNPVYFGLNLAVTKEQYVSLDLARLGIYPQLSEREQIAMDSEIHVSLRNVAIAHHIRSLVINESRGSRRNVVAILGANHVGLSNLVMPIMRLSHDVPDLEICFQDGYQPILREVAQAEEILNLRIQNGIQSSTIQRLRDELRRGERRQEALHQGSLGGRSSQDNSGFLRKR